jgi:hypothetical protein
VLTCDVDKLVAFDAQQTLADDLPNDVEIEPLFETRDYSSSKLDLDRISGKRLDVSAEYPRSHGVGGVVVVFNTFAYRIALASRLRFLSPLVRRCAVAALPYYAYSRVSPVPNFNHSQFEYSTIPTMAPIRPDTKGSNGRSTVLHSQVVSIRLLYFCCFTQCA